MVFKTRGPRDRRQARLPPDARAATYEDVYKLTYLRGPRGIIVMLAETLKKS